jgi:hypothetical protein
MYQRHSLMSHTLSVVMDLAAAAAEVQLVPVVLEYPDVPIVVLLMVGGPPDQVEMVVLVITLLLQHQIQFMVQVAAVVEEIEPHHMYQHLASNRF